jgi:hypothetical protein
MLFEKERTQDVRGNTRTKQRRKSFACVREFEE